MPTKHDFAIKAIRRALDAGERVALFDGTNQDGYSVLGIEGDNIIMTPRKPPGEIRKTRGRPRQPAEPTEPSNLGQPRMQPEKRQKYTLSLPDGVIEKLRQIGEGSASEGIVKLVSQVK